MKRLLTIIILLFATSCISNIEKRGFVFDIVDFHLIEEGITTRERVLSIMGSPTVISNLDRNELWIYYFEEQKRLFFLRPKAIDRKIVTIRFDKSNLIASINELSLDDENSKFSFDKRFTKVEDKKVSIFKEIFSNVGQVSAQ